MLRLILVFLTLALPVQANNAVGQVSIAGPRTLEICSGTLVGPDTVLTAAHCVADPRDGYAKPVDRMVFLAGWDGHSHPGASRIKTLQVHPKAFANGKLDLQYDIALITLSRPMDIDVIPVGSGPVSGPYTVSGYARSAPHTLKADVGCKGRVRAGLWQIGCPVEKGQSGGPVLYGEGATQRIVAVVVAIQGDQSLAVPVDTWLRQALAR